MADVKWIKLSTDIFDYDRIKSVEEIENGDAILCMWFMSCLSFRSTRRGVALNAGK